MENAVISFTDFVPMIGVIIGSIVIPLVLFIFGLRPFVRDSAKEAVRDSVSAVDKGITDLRLEMTSTLGGLNTELVTIRAELKAYWESHLAFIDLYKKGGKINNPHPNKGELLDKLKDDTITREEAIELQAMLSDERDAAESQNETLKAVILIGILALIAAALARRGGVGDQRETM